jgi:hypothetical protein
MTPSPLTTVQQEAVAVLVARARLTTCPADVPKAERFISMAEAALQELPHIGTQSVRYDVAYNAAHDIGEGLLAAYGFRTASGPGQHATVGLFLEAICQDTDAETSARGFDILRNTRNQLRYGAKQIGAAESGFAIDIATALLARARTALK